jgi:hypothetical protein
MSNTGYSIDIYFNDFSGGRRFGITNENADSISLKEFRDFCWDAGIAYGFTENQMDSIFNWELNDED